MDKVIFYFSGTGNSLRTAQIIAKEMNGARLVSMGNDPAGVLKPSTLLCMKKAHVFIMEKLCAAWQVNVLPMNRFRLQRSWCRLPKGKPQKSEKKSQAERGEDIPKCRQFQNSYIPK